MAIQTGIGELFLEELPIGIHKIAEGTPSDTFKVALYGPNASIGPFTATYTTSGEVAGGGYTPGGQTLAGGLVVVGKVGSSRAGGQQFSQASYIQPAADTSITVAGVAVRGCLLYNATQSNRTIFTLDFGESKNPSTGIIMSWAVGDITQFSQVLIPLLGLQS